MTRIAYTVGSAELAQAQRDAQAAAGYTEQAIPLLEATSPIGLARAYRVAAEAYRARGDVDTMEGHLCASSSAAQRYGQRIEQLRTGAAVLKARA